MNNIEQQKVIFGSIFLLANRLQTVGDRYLGEGGITTKQWFLTVMVSQFKDKPPTLSEVAELMGSSRQNVKQIALKLEEKGFLKIEKDARDSRAFRIRLTEKCRKFWEDREEQDNNYIGELFKDLTDEEITATSSSIKKLIDKVERMGKQYDSKTDSDEED